MNFLMLLLGLTDPQSHALGMQCWAPQFKEYVSMSRSIERQTYGRMFASMQVENRCTTLLKFTGKMKDGTVYLQYGMEAIVEYRNMSGAWVQFPGAGRDGTGQMKSVTIPKGVAWFRVDWPVSIFTDYSPDTIYRICLTDIAETRRCTESFNIYDIDRKLRVEREL